MTRKLSTTLLAAASIAALVPASGAAQSGRPENLLPESQAIEQYPVQPDTDAVASEPTQTVSREVVQQFAPLVQPWSLDNAEKLAALIAGIGEEGLEPADYGEAELREAMLAGPGERLDQAASQAFAWLVEDLRDGRTPMDARKQWFVVDPDPDRYRTGDVMERALASGDLAGALQSVAPLHPDYAKLKAELAATPASEAAKRKLIRANIVGKPGRTATPQLAETVEGVIFNPTWTVPQSIVKGEGLGARVLGNPGWARANGYKGTRDRETGFVTVVQQPGPGNSLGLMKLDMPNPHAIFLHDTPSRNLFNTENRALSHGCIRTERATELAITLAILAQNPTNDVERQTAAEEAVAILKSGDYTKVPFAETTMPVYITYFTMGTDIDGEMRAFKDIYGRDAPVLAALDAPREANRARRTDEKAVEIIDDMKTI